jgi:hypothetical protein
MKVTQDQIDEWRRSVAHADISDLGFEFEEDALETLRADVAAYTKKFAKPSEGRPCLACGASYGGFTWGLTHGHGHCSNCGWPATLYHYIKDREGKDIAGATVLLQVHPDQVSVRGSAGRL